MQAAVEASWQNATASSAAVRRASDLWWMRPDVLVLCAILPVYLSVLTFDFSRVVQLVYVPSGLYAFGVALILAVPVGAGVALANPSAGPALIPPRIPRRTMYILLIPALVAYALWFTPLIWQPHLLAEVAAGQRREVRDAISTIPGITTFTQFGPAYVIAYAIRSGAGVQRVSRWEHAGFGLLLLLAIFRAFAWAERLAVIEILLCFLVARLAYLPVVSRARWRALVFLPAVGPFILYGVFTASEYFRSWSFYERDYSSVWAFTLERMITYYATAVNNGIGVISDTANWPYYNGIFTFEWAYIMPGLSRLLESIFGNQRDVFLLWTETYGRPEFNSTTAYFRVLNDLGYFGSVLYFLILGFTMGHAYSGYRRGRTFGLLFYPVFVLFIGESLRYSYFAEPRIVPLVVGLSILAWEMRNAGRRIGVRVD